MRRIILGKTWALFALVVGVSIATSGFSYGMGKGIGKGKGAAVSRVTYNCLGFTGHARNKKTPYPRSKAMTLIVDDQEVELSGLATADLVEDDETTTLTHKAEASIATEGLSMFSFDTCGTSAESVFRTVVEGYSQANPLAFGTTDAEVTLVTTARMQIENTGSGGDFSASTITSLQMLGFPKKSFTMVRMDNDVIDADPGVEINVLPNDVYEFSHMQTVTIRVNFGPGIKNYLNTVLNVKGKVTGQNITGQKFVAGFAAVEAQSELSYAILSYNPDVSLRFVPTKPTGGNVIAEAGGVP